MSGTENAKQLKDRLVVIALRGGILGALGTQKRWI